jgi:Flp pilus assembly protein TadD
MLPDLDRAIELAPNDGGLFNRRGIALARLGRHEEALSDFRRAVELSPDDADAVHNRGITLGRLGDLDAAIADFDRALELAPNTVNPMYNKACALALLGNTSDSLTILRDLIRRFPSYKAFAREDPDLESLRSHKKRGHQFRRLVS